MKIYGGRRMYDLFVFNYTGSSFSTIKRQNTKLICFIVDEHLVLFIQVTKIYENAMEAHGINGLVGVILAEDETKVILRVAWESLSDTLVGFRGPKECHSCISAFKPKCDSGQVDYDMILESFQNFRIGSFARIIMVKPLHD